MNSCRVKTGNAKNSWRISWRHVLPEKMHFSKRWYPGFSRIPRSQVTRKSATFWPCRQDRRIRRGTGWSEPQYETACIERLHPQFGLAIRGQSATHTNGLR